MTLPVDPTVLAVLQHCFPGRVAVVPQPLPPSPLKRSLVWAGAQFKSSSLIFFFVCAELPCAKVGKFFHFLEFIIKAATAGMMDTIKEHQEGG